MPGTRPNVLWICTDQQRYDTIHALGNSHVHTPSIDRLANNGVAFTHAFAQSPVCTPSRAAFMTGRYPRTTKCRQNGQAMPPNEKLVSRLFADTGYICGLAGKLHLATCASGVVEKRIDDGYKVFHWSHHPQPDWPENAYTQWLHAQGTSWEELYGGPSTNYIKHGVPEQYNQTTWCAEKAIEFIRDQKGQPWFFSYNCFAPHHPFDPPAEFLSHYNPDDLPLPKVKPGELETKPTYQQLDSRFAHNDPGAYDMAAMSDRDKREITAAYYAMVELIDKQVGRMLDSLEETGQLDDTIVIFMSDHGEMLGDHGFYLKGPHFYDEAVRVPLIVSWKDRFAVDLLADGLTELIDIAPTLLEAAGIDVPEYIQGRTLMPILLDHANPAQHRDYVFSEYYNAWTHKHSYGSMLRTRDKKIIVYHGTDQGELYDLKADPDEFENLWSLPEHAGQKLQLMKTCFDASVFTMDPAPPRLGPF
ncbi:MAG: sulfatase-like hydrolase/transferase [Verrucomicrobiota bacterium]|jgi:arylsulfatase A-like enzyme|nr:sulfatase-like hydrolase/transferase [Verrucomicrobiota bacterium]